MDEAFTSAVVHWLLTRMAVRVKATEAFGYAITHDLGASEFEFVAHLRPDQATEEVRRQARKAFLQLAEPCVREGRHGAIEIVETPLADRRQFCLIVVIYDPEDQALRRGVLGVITRCSDVAEAKRKLFDIGGYTPKGYK